MSKTVDIGRSYEAGLAAARRRLAFLEKMLSDPTLPNTDRVEHLIEYDWIVRTAVDFLSINSTANKKIISMALSKNQRLANAERENILLRQKLVDEGFEIKKILDADRPASFDPDILKTVSTLSDALPDIDDMNVLEEIEDAELDGKNRETALEAIAERKSELSE